MSEQVKNFMDKFDTILILIGAMFLTGVYIHTESREILSLATLVWGGFLAATNQSRKSETKSTSFNDSIK